MKMKIIAVHEKGDAKTEYCLLEATQDCDLDYYAVADTTYLGENKVSNRLRHFYWFPMHLVGKGEQVVLRTGKGTNDQYTTKDGIRVHRFFWGLDVAVWNDEGDAAVLIEMNSWSFGRA